MVNGSSVLCVVLSFALTCGVYMYAYVRLHVCMYMPGCAETAAAGGMQQLIVRWDFAATLPSHLSVKAGDVVRSPPASPGELGSDWKQATLESDPSRSGWVPATYLSPKP